MARFDGIQRLAIAATQDLFGDVLVWVSSISGLTATSKVLYSEPEKQRTLGDAEKYEYSPYNYSFDYYVGQLAGLKESVDAGNVETVTVNGKTLVVREVNTRFDGKTYIADCDDYTDFKPEPEPEPEEDDE